MQFNKKILNIRQQIVVIKNNEHTEYKSVIENIGEDFIEIGIPSSQGYFMFLDRNDKYIIKIYTEQGIFRINVKYLNHYMQPLAILKITMPESMEKIQYRDNFRINDLINLNIYLEESMEKEERGYTQNISAGGMLIVTFLDLTVGQQFYIKFKIPFKNEVCEITSKCEIVRCTEKEIETKKNYYGIKFLDMEPSYKNKLVHYVFFRQSQIRRMCINEINN